MAKAKCNATKTNYKTRLAYTTGLEECINPEKCICIFCKRKREDKSNDNKKKV